MPDHFFQPPPSDPTSSELALQALAEQLIEGPKTLHELPLILVPPALWHPVEEQWEITPPMQAAIQTWLQEAHQDDERLRIERRLIGHTPIFLPDTPEGQQFFRLTKAIADIPLNAPIVPKNQQQGYWFKTLHYQWQARGVVMAQRLLGVIADPIGESGVLSDRLSKINLDYLRLGSEISVACFHLLTQGESYIKRWAQKNQVDYPFETPWDLFLEVLQEDFLTTWQLGPENQAKRALPKAQQRNSLATRIRLLRLDQWLPETGERSDYETAEQEYLQSLQQTGWSGYWLLALRQHQYEPRIQSHWEAYVEALSKGKEIFVDILD
ncbi:hypothetical protein [Trichocoleus sp. FACHB-262]|uniref:hypothetical protein n=1 Tax=Trichocoleus sp. FACHB-262 TaxID=2692869 RepID=UPI001685BAD2|nr:hypothetical protein [Trichocoleus sp. FACHB-262]MBD2124561.1 hypothetical protein [Trichocoleus sp. FACHB-262]